MSKEREGDLMGRELLQAKKERDELVGSSSMNTIQQTASAKLGRLTGRHGILTQANQRPAISSLSGRLVSKESGMSNNTSILNQNPSSSINTMLPQQQIPADFMHKRKPQGHTGVLLKLPINLAAQPSDQIPQLYKPLENGASQIGKWTQQAISQGATQSINARHKSINAQLGTTINVRQHAGTSISALIQQTKEEKKRESGLSSISLDQNLKQLSGGTSLPPITKNQYMSAAASTPSQLPQLASAMTSSQLITPQNAGVIPSQTSRNQGQQRHSTMEGPAAATSKAPKTFNGARKAMDVFSHPPQSLIQQNMSASISGGGRIIPMIAGAQQAMISPMIVQNRKIVQIGRKVI
ncbi:hypothetical protein FGO68_gene13355 [Halteria grandinella]|uniref:Uncharacterized protein n=1 Tax=Halteria grandinella TaxID=5974 RepID=A0A8J8P431_HALGN|nr:hypothetical protein FGO68_gene13355 [Halteria grandinella]